MKEKVFKKALPVDALRERAGHESFGEISQLQQVTFGE